MDTGFKDLPIFSVVDQSGLLSISTKDHVALKQQSKVEVW